MFVLNVICEKKSLNPKHKIPDSWQRLYIQLQLLIIGRKRGEVHTFLCCLQQLCWTQDEINGGNGQGNPKTQICGGSMDKTQI
jgi:hypothetical protein